MRACQPIGVTRRFSLKLSSCRELILESIRIKTCIPSSSILFSPRSSFVRFKLESCNELNNDIQPCEVILSESLSVRDIPSIFSDFNLLILLRKTPRDKAPNPPTLLLEISSFFNWIPLLCNALKNDCQPDGVQNWVNA